MKFEFSPIGYVRSPFKDRFGVPRQPGLAAAAKGVIQINPDESLKIALRELDQFSHLWIVFVFHDHGGKSWRPSIRPPRLGGQKKVGVLASRSPHRPNPIGISAVEIEKIDFDAEGGPQVFVHGIDLIDGTPVLDIKPYIPYADSIPAANPGWASEPIPKHPIAWEASAVRDLKKLARDDFEKHKSMIDSLLELDPRPASQQRKYPVNDKAFLGAIFGFDVLTYDVNYNLAENGFLVCKIQNSKKSLKEK